jgi:Mitochondrial carrier protein
VAACPCAAHRIVKEEGPAGLFRGAAPTVVRAMALNMGMLASNDQAKELLEKAGFEKGGNVVVLGGATIAGLVAAACRSRTLNRTPSLLPGLCARRSWNEELNRTVCSVCSSVRLHWRRQTNCLGDGNASFVLRAARAAAVLQNAVLAFVPFVLWGRDSSCLLCGD